MSRNTDRNSIQKDVPFPLLFLQMETVRPFIITLPRTLSKSFVLVRHADTAAVLQHSGRTCAPTVPCEPNCYQMLGCIKAKHMPRQFHANRTVAKCLAALKQSICPDNSMRAKLLPNALQHSGRASGRRSPIFCEVLRKENTLILSLLFSSRALPSSLRSRLSKKDRKTISHRLPHPLP